MLLRFSWHFVPVQVSARGKGETSINVKIHELQNLEPYVKITSNVDDLTVQEIDYYGALKDGFSEEIIDLAKEMAAFQNQIVFHSYSESTDDVSKLNITLEDYPAVEKFFREVTLNLNTAGQIGEVGEAKRGVNPCGNWDTPIPNYTPSRPTFSSSDPHQTLINLGFHQTASYACGGSIYYSCDEDYTRGRSYTSSYGTCSSPRFRDHGRVASSTIYSIQYGEPNPEILGYSWPYWNWGAYVYWWHENY